MQQNPIKTDRVLNQVFTNKNKRIRIVFRQGKYISKRMFKYTTSMGPNSAGEERTYEQLGEAVATEFAWLRINA